MFGKYILFTVYSLLLIDGTIDLVRSDDSCESIIPDAITQLKSGTIAVFQNKEVWFLEKEEKELHGPCPISQVFIGMDGIIDAAVTFHFHEMLTEFYGSSLYFGSGKFFTFKNLKAYEVAEGNIVYVPVKGEQKHFSSTKQTDKAIELANGLMAQDIRAAYFDPFDKSAKLIFADGTILGYNFMLSYDYELPVFSSLSTEFQKLGVSNWPKDITAALTFIDKSFFEKYPTKLLSNVKHFKLYIFVGPKYCVISFDPQKTDQKCVLRPNAEFFDCNAVLRKNNYCNHTSNGMTKNKDNNENPIIVPQKPELNSEVSADMRARHTVRLRDANDVTTPPVTVTTSYANPLILDSIFCKLILIFFIIFSFT